MPIKRLGAVLVFAACTVGGQTPAPAIQTEIVQLSRFGFTPRTIVRRTTGRHYLVVRVVTPLRPLSLSLEGPLGVRLGTLSLTREQSHWKQSLDLPAGTYLLKEASHPDWVCAITIGN